MWPPLSSGRGRLLIAPMRDFCCPYRFLILSLPAVFETKNTVEYIYHCKTKHLIQYTYFGFVLKKKMMTDQSPKLKVTTK